MRKILLCGLFVIFLFGPGIILVSAQEADARPDTEIVAEQYLLVGSLTWRVIYPLSPPRAPKPRPKPAYLLTAPHGFEATPETYEIWSATSRDGGKTFSAPMKVSTERSPGISRRRGMSAHGNDFIGVAVDDDFVHMTWFDNRSGFEGTWYGRVPIADYK